ncbi:hypothetical protein BDZ94DRAFT_1167904 [Collybia nuda]|uniref:Uncharacterized protein n=1 Tax=Collybia nuda TaxID=64659 RepID=A0A9P5Y4R2_9AGAR|nr:hypothetical protein BDZ94DRAFT_1167904 [Collybia nuda]
MKGHISNSDKRAKRSALIVRSLIIGPTTTAPPQLTPTHAKPRLSQIKSQLIKTKSANKVIAQLRVLPVSDTEGATYGRGPIHAVCLEHTDIEEHTLHFSCLSESISGKDKSMNAANATGAPSLEKLAAIFMEMNIVDLIASPDLGLGQPGDGEGILAGAVPTAETVLKGIELITPQLMALGFATGKAILPDHAGVYPPTDRMSVLTYWWGLELVLPPPSLEYLANVQSIAGTVVNFLSALSLINNGVREILPFVRYIAQFIDFEFNNIKRQDKGRGVVCAATWIMPAAMVPRPWDFPEPPIQRILPIEDGHKRIPDPPAPTPPPKSTFPPPKSETPPFVIPLPLPQIPMGLQSSTQPTSPVTTETNN